MSKQQAEKALGDLKDFSQEAEQELSKFKTVHEFPIQGECKDRNGELTRVLILNTDPEGIVEMDMLYNNPAKFDMAKGELQFDRPLLEEYMALLLNIDLSNDDNKKAVGWKARGKALKRAESFFTLGAASLLPDALGMDS